MKLHFLDYLSAHATLTLNAARYLFLTLFPSFTRYHMVTHGTQRNLLNNKSLSTPPKNIGFRQS